MLPAGVWPVLPAALTVDRQPDRAGHRAVVDWYVAQGCAGLFAVSLSSEMYQLSAEERIEQCRWTVQDAAGRLPVVAGALPDGAVADLPPTADPTVATVEAVRGAAATGVSTVVLVTSQLVSPGDGDDVLLDRLRRIVEATDVDLGLYECPLPYKRVLADEHMRFAADSGRFTFVKDTSHDVQILARKAALVRGTRVRVLNAQAHSVLQSVRDGGHGFSGWVGNVLPGLMGWLVAHAEGDDRRLVPVQRLLSVAEAVIGSGYPSTVKFMLRECFGVPVRDESRMSPEAHLTRHSTQPMRDLVDHLAADGLLGLRP